MEQHHSGLVPGYTQSRHPLELVWFHETELRIDALALELKVKDWSRAKKKALIRGDWDAVRRLSKGKQTRVRSPAAGPSLRRATRLRLGANGGKDTMG
jgi:predicted GIY-YIG superfamily endonuclease